jgi:hypothetical protein
MHLEQIQRQAGKGRADFAFGLSPLGLSRGTPLHMQSSLFKILKLSSISI